MQPDLKALLQRGSGTFQWPTMSVPHRVIGEAERAGWTCGKVRLDTTNPFRKAAMFAAFQRDLDLPKWFGHNWDALADALADWCPEASQRLLIVENVPVDPLDHPGAKPSEINSQMFVDIVGDASSDNRPFILLVTSAKPLLGAEPVPLAR